MTELVIIKSTDVTRRALCGKCAENETGTTKTVKCKRLPPMAPCTMDRYINSPDAKCPHDDPEHRVRWNAAALDEPDDSPGCEGKHRAPVSPGIRDGGRPPDKRTAVVYPNHMLRGAGVNVIQVALPTGPRPP